MLSNFFLENFAPYEMKLKNLTESVRPQITINTAQKLQFVCRITKAKIFPLVHKGEGKGKIHPVTDHKVRDGE
jgi:hypothetical protein